MKLIVTSAPHANAGQSARANMGGALAALLPCCAAGTALFGGNALALMLVSTASAVLAEGLWQLLTRQPVRTGDGSVAVTGLLLGLCLPPGAPLWLAAAGAAFAAVAAKGLFGGLGRNPLNPALAARLAMLAVFPRLMTAWTIPAGASAVEAVTSATDALSAATPLARPDAWPFAEVFLGRVPGCIGETCVPAILIGLTVLLAARIISWRIPAAMMTSFMLSAWMLGVDPLRTALSGGLLFAAVFMATDPVTSPMTPAAQIAYAALAGSLTALIRRFGAYREGVTYAVLAANLAVPLLDRCFRRRVYGHEKQTISE